VAVIVAGVYLMWALRKYLRRRRLVRTAFPEAWRTVLEQRSPFYGRLRPEGRRRFGRDVQIFLDEQRIYARGGAEVSDDVRVLISASAATLTYGMPEWEWGSVRDIIVYRADFNDQYEHGKDSHLSGMVHSQGPVLLSKPALQMSFRPGTAGHNVALHEFAHVMDFADGYADGLPAGVDWHSAAPWVNVVADRLRQVRREGHPALRPYAGVNEAELFAVAVEVFFERPEKLQEKDPELFGLLSEFFHVDPRNP
jgi:Mlc titration factor MtfA (ptsG expression regulator)